MSLVRFTGVTKRFGALAALDRLDLELAPGKIHGLLGPNGAGKTTAMRLILAIFLPDEGQVSVFGQPAGSEAKERIGYLPEERGLYRKMRVLPLLVYFAGIKGLARQAAEAAAREWLERFGLADRAASRVEELSKGNQQKVQFIATVLHRPELVILDEPFSGLDPLNVQLFREALLELSAKGVTLVLSTHQLELAERLCHTVCLIDRGRAVLAGDLETVRRDHGQDSVVIEFAGEPAEIEAPEVESQRREGRVAELALRQGADPQALLARLAGRVALRRFELRALSLQEIFLRQVSSHAR